MSIPVPTSATRSKPPLGEWHLGRVNTQVDNDPFESQRQELRGSLAAGWAEAQKRFRDVTGHDLNAFRDGKEGVLRNMEKLMSSGDHDIKKHQSTMATVEKVLNCVQFVGSVAAQGVSLVFSQAAMCFSAIEMLINVPKMYKELIDSLQELFANINEFFPKLKIFQRTDYNLGLDSALVTKLNEILIALVDTCALAIKVRKRKMIFVAKGLFLKQNEIQDAIKEFQKKIDQLDSLTVPVTLEKILETRNISLDSDRRLFSIEATGRETHENVQEVRNDVKEVSSGVQELLLFSTEGRNLKADQEKIDKIDKSLFVTKEAVIESLRPLEQCYETLLPETIEVLTFWDHFGYNSKPNPTLLAGERGTGRTFYLAALVQAIAQRTPSLFHTDRPKPIWAYYSFSDAYNVESGKQTSPFRTALRIMACQVARQSATYTRLLQKEVDTMNDAKDIRTLLSKLRLHDLVEQEDCAVYLLFDGLDQIRDLRELRDILSLASQKPVWGAIKPSTSWPRIVLAANRDVLMTLGGTWIDEVSMVSMDSITNSLLDSFVENGIEILQEISQKELRDELKREILRLAKPSFAVAQQKLDILQSAVADDLDFDELLDKISMSCGPLIVSQGEQILDNLFRRLSPILREQLKEILYWCYWGGGSISTGLLDSSLFLLRRRKPLESLEAKIRRHFVGVLMVANERDEQHVMLSDREVEGHLRQLSELDAKDSSPVSQSGLVGLNLGKASGVQRVLESLGKSFLTGDFSAIQALQVEQSNGYQKPLLSRLEAHWTIAMRCLQALNDDRLHDMMKPLIRYATQELPRHLTIVSKDIGLLKSDQRTAIVRALVAFFSDADRIEAAMAISAFNPDVWIGDRANVHAMVHILNDAEKQETIEPRDRRNASALLTGSAKISIPFLEPLAIEAGRIWLDEKRKQKTGRDDPWCYLDFIERYLKLVSKLELVLMFATDNLIFRL